VTIPERSVAAGADLRPVHRLLGVQSLVVVLVSVNRLGSWTDGYVARNEFLRWVDLLTWCSRSSVWSPSTC
jgi:hypothetical protein